MRNCLTVFHLCPKPKRISNLSDETVPSSDKNKCIKCPDSQKLVSCRFSLLKRTGFAYEIVFRGAAGIWRTTVRSPGECGKVGLALSFHPSVPFLCSKEGFWPISTKWFTFVFNFWPGLFAFHQNFFFLSDHLYPLTVILSDIQRETDDIIPSLHTLQSQQCETSRIFWNFILKHF